MGEIADSMIDGKACEECGVYLEPGETVYTAAGRIKRKMPKDGKSLGMPVICIDCYVFDD